MTFLRLAGCNVGKQYTEAERSTLQIMNQYQEKCHSWDGQEFCCDTDFQVKYRSSVEFLLQNPLISGSKRVLLTGGEPLIHDLKPLITALIGASKHVHIETSGTKPLDDLVKIRMEQRITKYAVGCGGIPFRPQVWITCSPKKDYLPEALAQADEIKVLVDEGFDESQFVLNFGTYLGEGRVWIQPVNGENTVNFDNLNRCLEIQKKYKAVRVSPQIHKFMKVR